MIELTTKMYFVLKCWSIYVEHGPGIQSVFFCTLPSQHFVNWIRKSFPFYRIFFVQISLRKYFSLQFSVSYGLLPFVHFFINLKHKPNFLCFKGFVSGKLLYSNLYFSLDWLSGKEFLQFACHNLTMAFLCDNFAITRTMQKVFSLCVKERYFCICTTACAVET